MPRKKRGSLPPPRLPATPRNDPYLLDEFSHQDLRTWKRSSELLNEYRVKQFYELESLRELHKPELSEALRKHGQVDISVDGWARIVNFQYSSEPLSTTGSLLHGGRFNIGKDLDPSRFPPFPALYIAERYETAYAERFGSPPVGSGLQPHELALRDSKSFLNVALTGHVNGLFDLRDKKQLRDFCSIIAKFQMGQELRLLAKRLGMRGPLLVGTPKDLHSSLLGNWRDMPVQYNLPSNSQVFARFLQQAGYEGVLYPSTRGNGLCVALFPNQLSGSDTHVELADKAPPEVSVTRLDSVTSTTLY